MNNLIKVEWWMRNNQQETGGDMREGLENQPIVDQELNVLERAVFDSVRIAQILADPEYANDFKRKLIYEQIQHVREGFNNWVNLNECRFNDEAQKYIFEKGEDEHTS